MKVAVKLQREPALSKALVDSLPPGQAHWWLRKDSDFIRLPKRVRGDEPLDLVVQLEPGEYILGVGPARGGVREDIEVKPPLAKGTGEAPAPATAVAIDVPGKQFVITGDLDSFDRDAAKAWLVSLGAKVTSTVSAKTDYLLVGREPGPKKLEKAAELGTKVITEAELRASLGGGAPATGSAAAPVAPNHPGKVQKLVKQLDLANGADKATEKLVGPTHFVDIGITNDELWGIAIGSRGGQYHVYIDLDDRPTYGIKCSCRARNPCKHGFALLLTADRHFIPPVPPPYGHEEASRYVPSWE
jgi:hypothetical protein